jgi:hypothetical protein
MGREVGWIAAVIAVIGLSCSNPMTARIGDPRLMRQAIVDQGDSGCEAAQLVSTGGAFPKDPKTLAIRWTGYTNYELAFNGRIILLDAHFDRGSMYPPLGFTAADVKRASVILLGHGHLDHMSDAASSDDGQAQNSIHRYQADTNRDWSRRRTARICRIQSRADLRSPR